MGNPLDGFQNNYLDARGFSMNCFEIMMIFHWTYDELMELPLPVYYALIEYLNKKHSK